MNSLYATLKTKDIPLKYDDVHKIISLDENAEETQLKPLDEIVVDYQNMDSAKHMDRTSILEQLRKKNALVTICETEEDKQKMKKNMDEKDDEKESEKESEKEGEKESEKEKKNEKFKKEPM